MMLMVFFIILPVVGLLAIFFQPVRWIFMLAAVAALAVMWLLRAFLFPGRMILSAVYGLLLVFTLVTALSAQNQTGMTPQANLFMTSAPAPAATGTPLFSAMYSTMGTSVPDGYYDDGLDADLPEMGVAGGSEDESAGDAGLSDAGASAYVPDVKTDAEIALENFMEKWRKGIVADMVEYTAPSWRASLADPPARNLFWKFGQKPLVEWRQMAAPTGTDASTARTITIQADVNYSGETRTYEYQVITLFENEMWYVDPDSLSTGILVEQATPTPDPNMTPAPTQEPTPTPAPSSKTKLYYNKNGGKRYHADPECSTVSKEYLPLKSFTYGNLSKEPYSELIPCEKCNAPARPSGE